MAKSTFVYKFQYEIGSLGHVGSSSAQKTHQNPKGIGTLLLGFIVACILGILCSSLGSLGVVFGPSWSRVTRLRGRVARLGAILGPSWSLLGPSWSHLRVVLGPSWALLGPSWGQLGHLGLGLVMAILLLLLLLLLRLLLVLLLLQLLWVVGYWLRRLQYDEYCYYDCYYNLPLRRLAQHHCY